MEKKHSASISAYVWGFVLSILLTLAAYIPTVMHKEGGHMIFAHELLIPYLLSLGVVQLVVQLYYFLHMGREKKPRWNLIFFISTVGLVLIVVVGAMWIMSHLNYNMTPQEMLQYTHDQNTY